MDQMPDWDDFRFFLELARNGKLSATAQKLCVEHTTVARRIARLEESIPMALFDRRHDGYHLTDFGKDILPHAEAIESAIQMAMTEQNKKTGVASGKVRIGIPEAFSQCVLLPRLPELYKQNPELKVELMPTHYFLNLAAREADILITLDHPRSGRYVVSRLTSLEYELHASREYLARTPLIRNQDDLSSHSFVDYVQDKLMSKDLGYLEKFVPHPNRCFTSSSILAQRDAVVSGMGISMMSPYVARGHENLVRVLPGIVQTTLDLWITAPADLFRLFRVRVCWDFLRKIAEKEPQLFRFMKN